MIFYFIERVADDGVRPTEVCVGSSLGSGTPYWAKPGAESVFQPLLFRDADYAEFCTTVAKGHDEKAGETGYSYSVGTMEMQA